MATYRYENIKAQYGYFEHPVVVLKINDKDISKNKTGLIVTDVEVELTSGYEASIATFSIYNVFDESNSKFLIEDVKKYICLGSAVEIALGYEATARLVFCGFIAKVNFFYEKGDMPGIRITAMDVKGIMMANNYSKQLTAKTYSAAVKEIFNKNAYVSMNTKKVIKRIDITDTPDVAASMSSQSKESGRTIEMVCESDYEFVVKAAKKYNYEFFTEQGIVYFRKAKSNNEILMELGPATGLRDFDIEYDITGLVEEIEARSMDNGKAKVIQSKKKFNNKISIGNKAKQYIKKSEKVYIDPTIDSKEEADYRVQSLMEEMSYRFGTLECNCIGMPELLPGRFIKLDTIGSPAENKFYIVSVKHRLTQERGFETILTGKAASIGGTLDGLI
jgi:phage protein D